MKIYRKSLRPLGFVLALAPLTVSAAFSQTAPTQSQSADEAQIQALTSELLRAIAATPNADARTFEARFALLIEQSGYNCLVVQTALQRALQATDNAAAKEALRSLRTTLAACPLGTGAGSAFGQGGPSSLPGISVGGGSDYLP